MNKKKNTVKYKCCNCHTVFFGPFYNWYSYYSERKFHYCPECDSKLVETYDFEYLGVLDKIVMRLIFVALIAGMIASYSWGWQPVGVLVFSGPALAAAILHVMYLHVINKIEDKKIKETKIKSKDK